LVQYRFGTVPLGVKEERKKRYVNFKATKIISDITTALPPPIEDLFVR
jgi:hypothetical protein